MEHAICLVLASHPEVEQAVLFGSRAKGTYKPGSDIDLALFSPHITERTLNLIYDELDDLPIPHGFSLVIFSQIEDPEILAHIERVGIVFYEKSQIPKPT